MSNPRFRGGYPLVRRVAKTDPEGAWSLLRAIATVAPIYANDNEPLPTYAGSDDYEPRGPKHVDCHTERTHKITPTVLQMLADALRPRIVIRADGTVFRHAGPQDIKRLGGSAFRLGDMIFNTDALARRPDAGGLMISYGWTKKGTALEPRVDSRGERGGKSQVRSDAAVKSYLRIRPTPEHRVSFMSPPAIRPMLDPTERAAAGKEALRVIGIDGDVPLAEACRRAGLPPRERIPSGLAWKSSFEGGVKALKETASRPPPELWATDPAELVRELSPHVQVIIEEIASRGSLKSLGIRLGYSEHYADRAGKDALAMAVEAVRHIFPAPRRKADNDNVPFRAASEGKV